MGDREEIGQPKEQAGMLGCSSTQSRRLLEEKSTQDEPEELVAKAGPLG